MNRPPVEEAIRDLSTKADKIRSLANAGYSRSEISKILAIRYQHVRNVLLRSGIMTGLRDSIEVPQSPIPVTPIAVTMPGTDLVAAGFELIGEWKLGEGSEISIDGTAPTEPGVYAFVLEGTVVYVGVTLRHLRGRMNQYRRGHVRQRTSARIKSLIISALSNGKKIQVLVAIPESSTWRGLPVNTAAGLEYGLIQAIRPQWNIQIGKVRPTTKS